MRYLVMKVRLNNLNNDVIETQTRYLYRHMSTIKKPGRSKVRYVDMPGFLDTETSHNHDEENPIGWIYQWAFELNGQFIIGRRPSEFIGLLKELIKMYNLNRDKRLVIFIHNAGYDLTYLINYLYEIDTDIEILAISARKIISLLASGIEFRCSYRLSNMSLDLYCKKMETETRKLVGAIDYNVIRYQDSELTLVDWEYMINDVASLKEAVLKDIEFNGDNVATLPLTSTGFVRRDCRRAANSCEGYREDVFLASELDFDRYMICKEEFSGGYSHGNRTLAGQTLIPKKGRQIRHRDFKSRYPASELLAYVPKSFHTYYDIEKGDYGITLADVVELCKDKVILCRIVFNNLKLKYGITAPYISASKIRNYSGYELINEAGFTGTDNGKVINANGKIALTVNEYDLKWILKQYTFKSYFIERVEVSERVYLPDCLREVILKYFKIKETCEPGIFRDKSKNKLNAIYGMTATDIVRTEYKYDPDDMKWSTVRVGREEVEEKLEKYYKGRNNFLPYFYGCWTTSHSRNELFTLIEAIGYENYIYSDTDSIFYYETKENKKAIDEYNKKIIALNMELETAVINRKGEYSYIGTFEDEEGDDYITQFRFLHSKCYALIQKSGKFNVTIAGVTKDNKKLNNERVTKEEELGSIDKLDDGFTFRECGGTKAKYVDCKPTIAYINGHKTEYSSACIITNTTKELGHTVENYMQWTYEEI